ncbi:venom metalloproteinase antarease TserMP_A-like [Centruroides sculpturatus]|uniref:venom metalloproteinase antarease TserMP_A-like n=1 Tax=Centruroides sculpturatus TaxID=218467 RepID=UPI000C6C9234|nr:venom metalloproteinase antarease TserMP_A-like [Centruroides sculpturatus]
MKKVSDSSKESQERYLDELELNLALRLIGHISYTSETEPNYIKESLYSPDIIAGSVLSKMIEIEDSPVVSRADIIVLLTG